MTTVHDFSARATDGTERSLGEWAGQVLLIVNTASACGFTPQYAALETLQQELGPRGFSVLAFPCNQFGQQEPGSDAEIADFCAANFGVSFPVFAKVDVNGPAAHPLWAHLKGERKGLLGSEAIKWNFTKFLVDPAGRVAARYAPQTTPERIRPDIERLLAAAPVRSNES